MVRTYEGPRYIDLRYRDWLSSHENLVKYVIHLSVASTIIIIENFDNTMFLQDKLVIYLEVDDSEFQHLKDLSQCDIWIRNKIEKLEGLYNRELKLKKIELANKKLVKEAVACTIYDCEYQVYVNGVIGSNIVYAIDKDGIYIPAKDYICEHVDYGIVQFYIGNYYENIDLCDKNNNAKWGYFDLDSGCILVNPFYEYAGPFYSDRACVVKNGKIGYINNNFYIVIDIIYDEVHKGKSHWYYENGRHIEKTEPWVVRKDNKWGYIDKYGKVLIPLNFEYASLFHENRAEVKINQKYGYINLKGDLVIKPVYDEIDEFKCIGKDDIKSHYAARVRNDGKYGFIDEDGINITECLFEEAFEFWDIGYAGVKYKNKWSIIDKTGKFVVYNKFDDIGSYYGTINSRYLARRRWGTAKEHYWQQTLGSTKREDVYFTIELNNKWGIMDLDFNMIMPEMNNHFVEFKGKRIYIKNGGATSMRKVKSITDNEGT